MEPKEQKYEGFNWAKIEAMEKRRLKISKTLPKGVSGCPCGAKGTTLMIAFHLCPLEDDPKDYPQ